MGSRSSMPSNRVIPLYQSRLWRAKRLDHGVGHPMRLGLAHGLTRWTEGHRGDLDGLQYRGTHRPLLLRTTLLRCCGPVTALEEEGVPVRQAWALSRVTASSSCGIAQREVPVAPFSMDDSS